MRSYIDSSDDESVLKPNILSPKFESTEVPTPIPSIAPTTPIPVTDAAPTSSIPVTDADAAPMDLAENAADVVPSGISSSLGLSVPSTQLENEDNLSVETDSQKTRLEQPPSIKKTVKRRKVKRKVNTTVNGKVSKEITTLTLRLRDSVASVKKLTKRVKRIESVMPKIPRAKRCFV